MEINVTTSRYTAQELQQQLNQGSLMCVVLGGDHPDEYIVIVENDIQAMLVKGILQHLGVEVCQEETPTS